MQPRLKSAAMKALHEKIALQVEASELLGLIVAEFESDPMSVQCFDLRTVERAKQVVARLKTIGF